MDECRLASDLTTFIREELLEDETTPIDDDTSLFESGLLDSMSLSSLILFIEQQVGVRIGPLDITYETFDTVGRMVRLVASKQQP